jgi:hypothetical protein
MRSRPRRQANYHGLLTLAEKQQIPILVFDLTRSVIASTIYRTRGKNAIIITPNEIAQFLSKSEVLVSLFKSVFFSPIIILFLQCSRKRSFCHKHMKNQDWTSESHFITK